MASKAPTPPSPKDTSAASTGTNVSTAIANAFLQNMNETTPDGTKTFDQTGSYSWTDPYTKESYTVPRFSVTQTLSPQQQAIKAQQDAADLNLASLGNTLSNQLGGQLTGNFKLGNAETEGRLMQLGRTFLDPMYSEQNNDLRTRLSNQGIKTGTEAYDREMRNLADNQNRGYNDLLMRARGQASQEMLTEDNQRINQISALLSGGQVSQPDFMTRASVSPMATTDNASIIANNYNQQLQAWKESQAAKGSIIGGVGGLFANALPLLSDKRAKEDIKKVGKTDDGMNVYSYRYKGQPQTQIGLMAQEVKKKKPKAVHTDKATGLMSVDYKEALK